MKFLFPAMGLVLIVLATEAHPDSLPMEYAMGISLIGILLVYIPLITEERRKHD